MKYISIDGDDVGRKITSCYLNNNCSELKKLSQSLKETTREISNKLEKYGFDIIFCAADGVVASTQLDVDLEVVFIELQNLAPNGITFSAGVGSNLRESYVALTSAKCNGKNCMHEYSKLDSFEQEILKCLE